MKTIGKMKLYSSDSIDFSLVSIGFECLDRDMFNPGKCYDTIAKTGVKRARVQTGWIKCETEKGVYDFTWLDSIVDNLLSRGIEPWFNVSYGNPLYMDNISNPSAVGCVPIYYGKEAVEAWLNYVRALARHYKNKISIFEIWNEPDHDNFWYPKKADPTDYAGFVEITGDAVRSILPDCKIGCCACSPCSEYLETFFSAAKAGSVDFCCVHLYMMEPEANYYEMIGQMRSMMNRYGHNKCELWQGEAGFPSWFPEKHFYPHKVQSSEHQQAVWMLRRFFLDASAGLQVSNYFQMADMWEKQYETSGKTQKKPAAQGIVNGITYTEKKACDTISRVANMFSGDVKPFEGKTEGGYDGGQDDQPGRMLFSFKRNNDPFYAYYVPYYIQDEVSVKNGFWLDIIDPCESTKNAELVLIDMYTGEVSEITPFSRTGHRIRFADLPYADYPMVICPKTMFETEKEG